MSLPKYRAKDKLWKEAHPERVLEHQSRHRNGISQKEVDELLIQQGGACAICGTKDFGKRKPHVDHDHNCCSTNNGRKVCGKCIRGVLCNNCNLMLGNAKDNPAILLRAIDYLSKGKQNNVMARGKNR